MDIHEHGYWLGKRRSLFDESLCDALVGFFESNGRSVVDFGCGSGDYINVFLDHGFECCAYDGNPRTAELTAGVGAVLDLSQRVELGATFDWVMSLEVGEHIPRKFEGNFIDNVHRHNNRGVVLSWAVPGQRGHGHVNCRSSDYVKSVFVGQLGYLNDTEAEKTLRQHATKKWFRKTIMVFRKVAL